MHDLDILLKPSEPWIFRADAPPAIIKDSVQRLLSREPGFRLFVLDGSVMRTWGALYDELTHEFGLPAYFGRNLNALDECLTDPDWLNAKGVVILVQDAERVLKDEPPETREGLFDVLRHAAVELSQPLASGAAWDRPAVPLHVILQSGSQAPIANVPALAI
jgi:hypothetical protein